MVSKVLFMRNEELVYVDWGWGEAFSNHLKIYLHCCQLCWEAPQPPVPAPTPTPSQICSHVGAEGNGRWQMPASPTID